MRLLFFKSFFVPVFAFWFTGILNLRMPVNFVLTILAQLRLILLSVVGKLGADSARRSNFMQLRSKCLLSAGVLVAALWFIPLAGAETIDGALARAYQSNPDLNAKRASLRAIDESVTRASSAGRPKVNSTADYGLSDQWKSGQTLTSPLNPSNQSLPRGAGVSVTQVLFASGKIEAAVNAAERGVIAERNNLANTEMQTLVDAATAYMDVLRDTSVVDLRKNNISVLKEQLRQTQDRFSVGEVTRTDVAQVEARLASAQADLATAEGTLKTSIAKYRQVIGEDPRKVDPARPLARFTYKSLNDAVATALASHPSVMYALVNVEVAEYLLRQAYSGLGPTLGVTATSSKRYEYQNSGPKYSSNSIVAQLTFPLYDGGDTHAGIRQAKEVVGQRRLEADSAREKVRAGVIGSWSQLEAAKARIQSANAQVEAATIALNGIREEAKVGQRTTLDVLLTDQDLLSARVSLVQAQRDRVVYSYALAQAVGQLNADNLKLNVRIYDPVAHYNAVSDKWFGIIPPESN